MLFHIHIEPLLHNIADPTQLGNPQTATTHDKYFHTNQFPGVHVFFAKSAVVVM